jgi:plasmid stability protein
MPAADGGRNWEAEKRRILEALETEEQGRGPSDQAARRLKIREIVRTADQALAEKDREIEQIKHVLQEQSNNLQGMAVGAAGLDAVLAQDPLIREQRARLQKLEAEWQEKLRGAEIELSLERARLAREKIAIEDKIRAHEEKLAAAQGGLLVGAKPARGRWLARLGLKDGNGE